MHYSVPYVVQVLVPGAWYSYVSYMPDRLLPGTGCLEAVELSSRPRTMTSPSKIAIANAAGALEDYELRAFTYEVDVDTGVAIATMANPKH